MKKMAVFILLLLLSGGCSRITNHADLEKSIQSIVKDKNKNEMNMKALTNFDWDKAFLFTPYTSQENIKEQLGINYKNSSHIESRDDIYLLVFLKGNKVVQHVLIQRLQADFSIGKKEYLTPSNSSISIQRH